MSNFWRHHCVPHKGWTLVDVIDVREDGTDKANFKNDLS
jgi:hypothetical protein